MALINTAENKYIQNPSNIGLIDVDYIFIIPTIDSPISCTVQVRLSSDRLTDNGDRLQHNIGSTAIDGLQDPLLEDKLHAFCIEKLGSSFEKL